MNREREHLNWSYAVITLAITLLVLASTWVDRRIRNQLQTEVKHALEAVVEAERWGVHSWYQQQRILAATLAEYPLIKQIAQNETVSDQLQTQSQQWFKRVSQQQYLDYALIDASGQITSSNLSETLGKLHPVQNQEGLLQTVLDSGQVKFSQALPQQNDARLNYDLYLVAPVSAPDQQKPQHLLVLRLNPNTIFPSLIRTPFLGQTGETYLVDARGLMLSPSRFDLQLQDLQILPDGQSSALHLAVRNPGFNLIQNPSNQSAKSKEQPLTPMAAQLAEGHSGARILPYRDYRGVPVVGAWRWDEQLGMGIATEQDASEAFAGIREAEWILYGFTFFGVLLLIGLSQAFRIKYRQLKNLNQVLLSQEFSFYKVFNSAQDAILILDQAQVQECNQAAVNLLQRDSVDIVGQNWGHFSPFNQPDGRLSEPSFQEKLDQASSGEAIRFDWRFIAPDGSQFSADIRFNPLHLDKTYVQAVIRERHQDQWTDEHTSLD